MCLQSDIYSTESKNTKTEFTNMKKGDRVYTPRFCSVKIEEVFPSREEAAKHGYTEPTHYHKDGYTVLGWFYELNHAQFAAVKE